MHEQILADFLADKTTAQVLAADLEQCEESLAPGASAINIADMAEEFFITSEMAIKLCDAVLAGELAAAMLRPIGFAIVASEKFCWDFDGNDVLGEVLHDWSCPEINYPLIPDNIRRFRRWLRAEEPYPEKRSSSTSASSSKPAVVSWMEKRSVVPKVKGEAG
jgi:hypothetical protein